MDIQDLKTLAKIVHDATLSYELSYDDELGYHTKSTLETAHEAIKIHMPELSNVDLPEGITINNRPLHTPLNALAYFISSTFTRSDTLETAWAINSMDEWANYFIKTG